MKNIHVIPTDKPSSGYVLGKCIKELSDVKIGEFTRTHNLMFSTEYFQPQNIYITSDEEIKVGDCYYLPKTNSVYKCNEDATELNLERRLGVGKIILTTDQDLIKDGVQAIDDNFLEWFVKNPGCDYVKVEVTEISCIIPNFGDVDKYRIVIPKEEPKQTDENGKPLTYWGGLAEHKQETLADKLKKLLDNMSQEEFDEEWKKVTDLKLEGPSIIQHVELINKNIDEFDSKVKEFKEEQKQHLIDMMKTDEELGLYEEPKTNYSYFIKQKEEEFRNFLKKRETTPEEVAEYLGFVKGVKWKIEQDRWKTVSEETPPNNIELLVQSPEGIVHLSNWRESYNIFTCQVKSESSYDWKWKKI